MDSWVILGCGFIGTRLVKSLIADGKQVMACVHRSEYAPALERTGADVLVFEATRSRAFQYAMGRLRSPVVVYALPPLAGLPGGEPLSRATAAALKVGAHRFIYLSSIAVYGEGRDNVAVDEDSPTAISDGEALPYISAETAIDNARGNGLDGVILRLASVYGPGRGIRDKLLGGTYKMLDDGSYVFSRTHVDDVVGIVRTVAERAPSNALYCVADDRPCPQQEYVEWLAGHLGVRMPGSVPTLASGMPRRRVRNRPVANARLKSELDYSFLYPTYREGELAIEKELGTAGQADGAPAAAKSQPQETSSSPASVPSAPEVMPAESAWPLVVHGSGVASTRAAGTSQLRRLAGERHELAPASEVRIDSHGEALVCVLAGSVGISHGGATDKATTGDLVEVIGGSVLVENTGSEAARLVVISA